MNVSVFGLGYVGLRVGGVVCRRRPRRSSAWTSIADKVDAVNAGRSPIVEPGLEELLAQQRRRAAACARRPTRRRRFATRDVSLLCVGTPSRRTAASTCPTSSASPSRSARRCATSRPITSSSSAAPCCRARRTRWSFPRSNATSGKKYGDGFGVSVNPEFLREGTALKDFRKPPLTLVGHNHAADATGTIALYQSVDAPLVSTSIRVAEMMKYTSNTWHALKVVFANEIGNLCKKLDVDSHEVMDIFCRDHKLNLSSVLPEAGVRVRRLVPAEGRARAAVSRHASWTSSCR